MDESIEQKNMYNAHTGVGGIGTQHQEFVNNNFQQFIQHLIQTKTNFYSRMNDFL